MENPDLREFLENRINQERELRELEFLRAAQALESANKNLNIRLEQMNELRNQINSERGSFFTKNEQAAFRERVDNEIRVLRESKVEIESRASQTSMMVVLGISIVSIVTAIIALFLKK